MIRINAVRFAQKNRTGQPWVKPGHDEVMKSAKPARNACFTTTPDGARLKD